MGSERKDAVWPPQGGHEADAKKTTAKSYETVRWLHGRRVVFNKPYRHFMDATWSMFGGFATS